MSEGGLGRRRWEMMAWRFAVAREREAEARDGESRERSRLARPPW